MLVNKEPFISLVTTEPNDFIKEIHHRMPVIIQKDSIEEFFNNSVEDNIKMSIPYQGQMEQELADI